MMYVRVHTHTCNYLGVESQERMVDQMGEDSPALSL